MGRVQRVGLAALLHPLGIAPLILQIPNDRRGPRSFFVQQPNRVRLIDTKPWIPRLDVKLVQSSLRCARDEAFPDAGRSARAELVRSGIPPIEAAHHRE